MAQHLEGDWLELATVSGNTIMVLKAAHPRARRLRLTVTPTGARVTYPNGTHPAQVNAFLRSHAEWLEQKLDELHLIVKPLPPLRLGYPCSFPLRGELAELDWAEGAYPKIEPHATGLTLVIPRPHTRALPIARGLLASHLEVLIRRDVSRWLATYVPQLGLAPTALKIRPMKSLWEQPRYPRPNQSRSRVGAGATGCVALRPGARAVSSQGTQPLAAVLGTGRQPASGMA